jgi:hypothetical protein
MEESIEGGMVLDALPYIDSANEDYEQYALALIDDEMNNISPMITPKSIPTKFRTPLMKYEFSLTPGMRELDRPDSETRVKTPETENNDDWKRAVEEAKIVYEWERLRSVYLEIDKAGEGNAASIWMQYNHTLDHLKTLWEQALHAQRDRVEEVNHGRQQEQLTAGEDLTLLATDYNTRIQKLITLKEAVANLNQQTREGSKIP